MKWNNIYTPHWCQGETNNKPSQTVPDQSLSIREIMKRYASGLPLGGGKEEIWLGEDDDLPDTTHMDLADKQAVMEEYAEELKQIKSRQKKIKNEPKALETIPTNDDPVPGATTGDTP